MISCLKYYCYHLLFSFLFFAKHPSSAVSMMYWDDCTYLPYVMPSSPALRHTSPMLGALETLEASHFFFLAISALLAICDNRLDQIVKTVFSENPVPCLSFGSFSRPSRYAVHIVECATLEPEVDIYVVCAHYFTPAFSLAASSSFLSMIRLRHFAIISGLGSFTRTILRPLSDIISLMMGFVVSFIFISPWQNLVFFGGVRMYFAAFFEQYLYRNI
nr:MAG TPA: hypothetical protein [Caudoviricetes sp.]